MPREENSTSPEDSVQEVSAGVISFRVSSGERKYLLLKHANGGHWSFPKGHVEPGEGRREAAVRELHEETGLSISSFVRSFREESRYSYTRCKKRINKLVIYFLADVSTEDVELSGEHLDYSWKVYERALDRLTYENDRNLLNRAESRLIELDR
ncbi:MAG: bis(5'-nucleosyl)-tetraphosphatase [Candidatus Bipolaricaulota bacterium]